MQRLRTAKGHDSRGRMPGACSPHWRPIADASDEICRLPPAEWLMLRCDDRNTGAAVPAGRRLLAAPLPARGAGLR